MSEEAAYTAYNVAPADVSDFVRARGEERALSFHPLYRGLTVVEACTYTWSRQQGFPFSDKSYSTMQDAMTGVGVEFVAVVPECNPRSPYDCTSLFERDSTLYYGVSEGMLYTGENPEALGLVCLHRQDPGFTVTSAGQVGGKYYDCRVLWFPAGMDSLADEVDDEDDEHDEHEDDEHEDEEDGDGTATKPLTAMDGLYWRMHRHPDASAAEMDRNRHYWILLGTMRVNDTQV